jgi:hypothetical protein
MLEPVEIIYQKQVSIDIASDAINHINFDNFRITKLIGNISSFTSILSDQGSDLFISPKLQAGKKIEFSVMLATGDIIDFLLNIVRSSDARLVKLKFSNDIIGTNKSEALKMIEAMHSGRTGKYYVQTSNQKINISSMPKIKGIIQNNYRFGNLHGMPLILENIDHHPLKINADELAKSVDKPAAIYIEQELLAPKGKTKIHMVFKESAL